MAGSTGNRDNIKFWTVLAGMILLVSVAVLLIDMSIKAAILGESNSLRLLIEGEYNDRAAKASSNGTGNHTSGTNPVLGEFPAGMEVGNVANRTAKKATQARNRNARQTPRESRSGELPSGN